MKTNGSFSFRCLTGIALLCSGAKLIAAPLTWFPGPSLDAPVSGAATCVSGGNNVLIGGDSYYPSGTYPKSLSVTNVYWTYLSPMYGVRIAPGVVPNGGTVVVYGGSDGTSSLSSVTGYSPSGDTPLTLASMSVARSDLGYAPDRGGNAYAIGGLDDLGRPLSSAESYNPDSDTWSAIAPLPLALYHFPAVFDRTNHIYVFGGYTNTAAGSETAAVLRYTVSANSWTVMAPLPIAVAGSAAALGADGKIYVVGGVAGGVTTRVVQAYNPAANSWVISTPLPEGLSAAAMGVDSLGRLILMGGIDTNGNDVSDVWRSQQLGTPDLAPTFTQYPGTNGGYQIPYTSSVSATGNPQPTYLVLSGPAGMQVDAYSGAITWTPQADRIGSNSVTIRATNYAGFADWNFIIVVAPPPPTIPTDLMAAGETENSVTLSWAPESPLVGPVSYTVYERHVAYQPKGGSRAYYVVVSSGNTNPTVTLGGLAVGSSHTYAVTAIAAASSSGMSQDITITTLSPQPAANFRLTALTSTSTSVAWDPSPGPVPIVSYSVSDQIYYTAITGAVETNVTGITGTSMSFAGQSPGLQHYYFLYAHDAAGNTSPAVILGVINPVPAPAALSSLTPTGGGFQFKVQANTARSLVIQAAANLADPASWVTIATSPPTNSAFTFTDTNSGQFPTRFYRVLSP